MVTVSADLLKTNGRLAMVHRPDRFLDILHAMEKRQYCAEKARFVYPKPGKEANVLLIEGIKQGKKDVFSCVTTSFYIQ